MPLNPAHWPFTRIICNMAPLDSSLSFLFFNCHKLWIVPGITSVELPNDVTWCYTEEWKSCRPLIGRQELSLTWHEETRVISLSVLWCRSSHLSDAFSLFENLLGFCPLTVTFHSFLWCPLLFLWLCVTLRMMSLQLHTESPWRSAETPAHVERVLSALT